MGNIFHLFYMFLNKEKQMSKVIDMTGKSFGRLTVLSRAKNDKYSKAQWLCQC